MGFDQGMALFAFDKVHFAQLPIGETGVSSLFGNFTLWYSHGSTSLRFYFTGRIIKKFSAIVNDFYGFF